MRISDWSSDVCSQSHTGAMAGNDVAIDTFLREHGAVRVNLLDTLYEIIPLASRYCRITPSATTKPTVAVLTNTGGGAATVVDAMNQLGLMAAIPPKSDGRRVGKECVSTC